MGKESEKKVEIHQMRVKGVKYQIEVTDGNVIDIVPILMDRVGYIKVEIKDKKDS